MNINVIASSSKGNAAIITYGNNQLLLDAGIPIKKIEKAFNYDFSKLDGCLISHEHMDHARAVNDLMRLSVNCYMSDGTFKALKLIGHNIHIIQDKAIFYLKNWLILPITLTHDSYEPLGFVISIGNECLLYAVDMAYIPYLIESHRNCLTQFYKLNRLTHIMIECNYSLDIVREKTKADELPVVMKNRLLKYHMSLETCKQFLIANDLTYIKEIWLLHISNRHGNKKFFKEEIQRLTGKIVKTI